jgi:hypothetical protein
MPIRSRQSTKEDRGDLYVTEKAISALRATEKLEKQKLTTATKAEQPFVASTTSATFITVCVLRTKGPDISTRYD